MTSLVEHIVHPCLKLSALSSEMIAKCPMANSLLGLTADVRYRLFSFECVRLETQKSTDTTNARALTAQS